MLAATITQQHSNLLFAVSAGREEFKAIQLSNRVNGTIYAATKLNIGDTVLVEEVSNLSGKIESVSHVILGLITCYDALDYIDYSTLAFGKLAH